MLTRTALVVLFLLALPALAEKPRTVTFDIQMAVKLGERKMVAQPKLKVASEQEASIVIAEEGQTRLELSITPKVEDDVIRLVVKVLAIDGENRLQRSFQYVSIPGEAAQFADEDAHNSLKLIITPTLSD